MLGTLATIVGERHVVTGEATETYVRDWTGRFRGNTLAVVRPADTEQVRNVLMACGHAGVAVVPQGGNTGLVGGGVPRHGEIVLNLQRLQTCGDVDRDSLQVTVGAGMTLQEVNKIAPGLELGISIASRDSATVGGAIATNAGGLRVLRYGTMRAQVRGIEAVLPDGSVVKHLAGLRKDNTGYDYPSLLAGSEGTLAVITAARLQLVAKPVGLVTALIGTENHEQLHALAMRATREVKGLLSAEFIAGSGLELLLEHTSLERPLAVPAHAYLLLEASGSEALDDLAALATGMPVAVGELAKDRRRLWAYRERMPEAAGFIGAPLKLDVSVPSLNWTALAREVLPAVRAVDTDARIVTFGHIADGNIHVNVVPAGPTDGRHEDAVFGLVASLGGSISAEHGIGALKARWLSLARTEQEQRLFRRIRAAFDPEGILNPHVLPR